MILQAIQKKIIPGLMLNLRATTIIILIEVASNIFARVLVITELALSNRILLNVISFLWVPVI